MKEGEWIGDGEAARDASAEEDAAEAGVHGVRIATTVRFPGMNRGLLTLARRLYLPAT